MTVTVVDITAELGRTEAADACDVSIDTIKRRLRAGAFPNARQVGIDRSWVITVRDLVDSGLLPTSALALPSVTQPAARAAMKSHGHNTSPTPATAQLAEDLAENRGLRVELARADGSRPQSASPLDRQSGITNCSRPRRRQQRGAHLTPLGGLAMSRACRQCHPGLSKFTVYGSSSTPTTESTTPKEKFGGLRFSTAWTQDNDNADAFRNLIRAAEAGSYEIGQYCGSGTGVTTAPRPRWVRTLCSACADSGSTWPPA